MAWWRPRGSTIIPSNHLSVVSQIAYLLQAIFLELQFKVHEITDCAKNVYLQRILRKTLLINTQHLLAEANVCDQKYGAAGEFFGLCDANSMIYSAKNTYFQRVFSKIDWKISKNFPPPAGKSNSPRLHLVESNSRRPPPPPPPLLFL